MVSEIRMNYPKVVVQILLYNESDEEIDRLFQSLEQVDYPHDRWMIVVVNNHDPSRDIATFLSERWLQKSEKTLPRVHVVRQVPNLGFAGGHNVAEEQSHDSQPDYLYLLNADAFVEPTFLWRIVQNAEAHPESAIVQSRIMLAQEPELLNTRGNALHFLGFGFCLGYRQTPERAAQSTLPSFYASGAGMLVRASVLERLGGLFEPSYFMYHEDVDLCWRARLLGYEIGYANDSIIYHRYEFSRSIRKFYWMERNRHLTNLVNYHWGTLLLLLPAAFVMELGTLWFASKSGWGKVKLRSWLSVLSPMTWLFILRRRRRIQPHRVVADRQILRAMVGVIENQEVENTTLTYVVNPVLRGYVSVVKWLVRW